MNLSWLKRYGALVLVMCSVSALTFAQNDVTFRVNMKIKMLEGTFRPGEGDIVRLAGSINDWGNSLDTLYDVGTIDSIYEKTLSRPDAEQISYKFLKTLRGGSDWEGGDNRMYTVTSGTQSVPVVYFDYDSVYTPPVDVNVTFKVNMRVKILEGTFQPGAGDVVRVAGSINDWGNSTDTLKDVAPLDSIFEKTLSLTEGLNVQYKFLKTPRGGSDWEQGDNRSFDVPTGGGTVGPYYFDYDSVVNSAVTANILWHVNLSAYQTLGWFRPDLGDSIEVRGGFNSWGGDKMQEDPFTPGAYEFLQSGYVGSSGDELTYKYFIDFDSAGATARFPLYVHSGSNATRDGHAYDHPAERGDGNRIFLVNQSGDISPDLFWFSSINPAGMMLNTGDSCRVTLRVNMGPATRYSVPFDPNTDTVYVIWQDALWRSAQIARQGAFASPMLATRNGPTDSVYSTTFTVRGKTHYNMQYTYRFVQPGGTQVDEGGGLGAQNPFRSRYIVPTAPNVFAPSYTAPVDNWQKNAPMPAEPAPFNILAGVSEDNTGTLPVGYSLAQNYPNPFNPTTYIKYSIPQSGPVTLKVYNLIGQEVATLVNENQAMGNYIATFEANRFASGVYFYKIEAGGFKQTKKMLLLK